MVDVIRMRLAHMIVQPMQSYVHAKPATRIQVLARQLFVKVLYATYDQNCRT